MNGTEAIFRREKKIKSQIAAYLGCSQCPASRAPRERQRQPLQCTVSDYKLGPEGGEESAGAMPSVKDRHGMSMELVGKFGITFKEKSLEEILVISMRSYLNLAFTVFRSRTEA